jgi:hypothetical protein
MEDQVEFELVVIDDPIAALGQTINVAACSQYLAIFITDAYRRHRMVTSPPKTGTRETRLEQPDQIRAMSLPTLVPALSDRVGPLPSWRPTKKPSPCAEAFFIPVHLPQNKQPFHQENETGLCNKFRLRLHGLVDKPCRLDFGQTMGKAI